MSKSIAFASTVFISALFSTAANAACTVTYTFTNGTTADATQVNQNFTDIGTNCAPLASPNFTGLVGIGMAPSHVLDITQSQNTSSFAGITNGTNGTGAAAGWAAFSSSGQYAYVSVLSPSFTTNGVETPNTGVVVANADLALISLNGVIKFSANGVAENGRFGTDGSFLVGTTTNGGWVGNAKIAAVQSSGQGISLQVSGGGGNAVLARVDNASSYLASFYYTTSNVGSISTNGTITTYNTSSDKRLKSDFADLSAALSVRALSAYHPQAYLLRGRPNVGAVAQDVYSRMEAIGVDAAGIGLVTKGDDDPNLKEGQKGFRQWSMDSSKMTPYEIAVLLDHEKRLNRLEAENTALSLQVHHLISGENDKSSEIRSLQIAMSALEGEFHTRVTRTAASDEKGVVQ